MKKLKLLTIISLSIFSWQVLGQISGTVFKDFNANGTKENIATYNEPGMEGVVVSATNPTGGALTVTYTGGGAATNTTGGYTISGGTLGQIRLQFTLPDSYTFATKGATGGTTIMFPTGATQDLAVNYPGDYSQPNPEMAVSLYVAGTLTGIAAPEPAYVKFSYDGYDKYIGQAGYVVPTTLATHSQLGAVSGAAYSRTAKKIYTSAVLRRHVVFGPQGIGGIYEIDPATNSITNWLNIETLAGIDAGTDTRNSADPANEIPDDPGDNSYDFGAFALVGKQSLGDVDISDDGTVLFVTNLFQQSVVAINVQTKALIGSYPITASALGLTCPQADIRPWGLKYYKGKLYVGMVCSAESSQASADMKGYVLEFNPNNPGGGFSVYYSLNLNYIRELGSPGPWKPWHQNAFDPGSSASDDSYNPQPILSDIEFDVDGSLILGFLDRHTMMFSSSNLPPDPTASSSASTVPFPAGDILRVCKTSTGFALEGNAGCAYNFPYSNGGEFYNDKRQGGNGNGNIKETAGGSLALLPGYGQIVSTTMDEYDVNENGIAWWNNTTGVRDKAYMLYDGNVSITQGKASGLGDVELLIDPAPIEIGNRVWVDTNNDGVQDAGEPALSGVTVTLCLASAPTSAIANATTDGNGNYYFSSATGTSNGSAIYGLALAFNTNYILKFPTMSGTKTLTTKDLGGNDLIDSDAGANGQIAFTTGYAGENNHSFDVGYVTATACVKPVAGADQSPVCLGNTPITTATLGATAVTGGEWTQSAANPAGAAITDAASATSGVTGLTPGVYEFIWATSATCSDTIKITIPNCACVKPEAGTLQNLTCLGTAPITTATLAATAVIGGTWSQAATNPVGAVITNTTSATSGLTGLNPGVYQFIWSTAATCSDTVKIVVPNCQAVAPCTPDAFAFWSFEDCSPGSNTPNDGMVPTAIKLSGCSDVTVSELTRNNSGNSCQARTNGTTAICMGSATDINFVDNSDKSIMFSLAFPAGSTGKLSSINFETMVPTYVDFNNSGDQTNLNNYPTLWGIRVLKDNVEIFKLIDQPLTIDVYATNNLDWSTNAAFDINGAATFKFEIMGYRPSNVAGAGIREIWDLDELKVFGYCGNCATCVKPDAGEDQTLTCSGSTPITTATLDATPESGAEWTQLPGNPLGAVITSPSSATSGVSGMNPGVYEFIWATTASCRDTVKITIPDCSSSSCLATISAVAGQCAPATDHYTLTGNLELTNPPATGTITVQITGGGQLTFTLPQTYPLNYNLPGQTSDGASHTVTVSVSGVTCTDNAIYTAPASCSVCNVSAPILTVTDNICPSRIGSINVVQGCGAGSFIEYSTNNGVTWSTTKPLYATIAKTILARCVNIADNNCNSTNASVTTYPQKCPDGGSDCTVIATATVDPCQDNGTGDVATDDYFTVQVNASASNGGSSQRFEVVIGASLPTGIGGNVLNSGGTPYGSPVTVGQNKQFKADGSTSYSLIVRDIDNKSCFQQVNITPVAPCSSLPPKSPCYPVPCVPIGLQKN